MAGSSLELIGDMADTKRPLTLFSMVPSQLFLKYDLCGVQTGAACLGEISGLTPVTFALLVYTSESGNRNSLFKAKQVLYKS